MSENKRFCKACGREKLEPYCAFCKQETDNMYTLDCSEKIDTKDSVEIRQKRPGAPGFIRKLFQGYHDSGDIDKHPDGVNKLQDINRENNLYDEKVVDIETGEIIRNCHEKLSEHTSHGDAKKCSYKFKDSIIMHLENKPFNLIHDGHKTIEIRLNDPKRSTLEKGNIIKFINNKTGEGIEAEIIDLLNYTKFEDLLNNYSVFDFGDNNKKNLLESLERHYSREDEYKYGVLGIKIKVLNKK